MGFTPRQAQILELAAQGRADKEIARDLGLSVNTVRSHLQRLYQSEGLANRAEAVAALIGERVGAGEPAPAAAASGAFVRQAVLMGGLAGAAMALTAVVLWITAAGAAAGRAPAPSASVAAAAPRQVGPSATLRAPAPSRAPTAPPAPTSLAAPAPAPTTPIQMLAASGELDLVNHERASASLPPLAWNPCLAGVAGTQSRRLAQQGYVSPADGTAAAAGCRLALTPTAELLAYWPGLNDTQVNAMLIANPGDRAVLLGPYRYLGACWTVGPTGLAFLAIELA